MPTEILPDLSAITLGSNTVTLADRQVSERIEKLTTWLQSFVSEVQTVPAEGIPVYLTQFDIPNARVVLGVNSSINLVTEDTESRVLASIPQII